MKRSIQLVCVLVASSVLCLASIPAVAVVPGVPGDIVFTSHRDGNYEIYVMDASGSNQTRLTTNTAFDDRPIWSPDGTKIAFTTGRDSGGGWEIYTMDPDGSNPTRLTTSAAQEDSPVWSPDGTKIAYASDAGGDWEIWVMDANGSNPVQLTNNSAVDDRPDWSPDGTKIAFTSNRTTDYEIFSMGANGGNQINLTNSVSSDELARWSPDGTKIAFTSLRDSNPEVYVMNPDGGGQTNLTSSASWDSFPDWRPDGMRITFTTDRAAGDMDIFSMNPDGTIPTNLTQNGGVDQGAAWQPLPAKPDTLIKRSASTVYVGDEVLNETGSGQTLLVRAKPGKKLTFDITAQNDATAEDWQYLGGCGASKGFGVTYLLGTWNFTLEATNGGLSVGPVWAGGETDYQVVVSVKRTASAGMVKSCLVTTTSQSIPSAIDAVKIKVKVT